MGRKNRGNKANKVATKRNAGDDVVEKTEEPIDDEVPHTALSTGEESTQQKEQPAELSKKEKQQLRKLLQRGKITREEFEERMGFEKSPPSKDTEEVNRILKAEEYASGLQGFQERKGLVDSTSRNIKVESFTVAYRGQTLIRDSDLIITHGRKYGLIGPNGAGKSTLLRHIAQRHLPIPKHINILFVEQEVEGTTEKAIDAVISADTERTALLEEEKKLKPISEENTEEGLEAADRLIEVYKRLNAIGAYSAQARAAAILSGLQFSTEMQSKMTKEFSGGWRMRIALARALFLQPALLLLDEPTNHLDLDAAIWLEAYLRKYKKTLLLVSHDREFLSGVVTDIIDLREQQLFYYKGNYEAFERTLAQRERTLAKKAKKDMKELKDIQKKQTVEGKKKKQKIIKAGGGQVGPKKEYRVKFIFRDPGKLKPPVIQVKETSFGYKEGEENLLFKDIELNIDSESKVVIVGPNGTGKSTLMNMILGELEPTKGEIIRNRHLVVCKFSQHFVDQLQMSETPIEYLCRKFPELQPQQARNKLGMFGLKGKSHNQSIALLSGGQKSRVALTEIHLRQPHILFLDEPTNHLDIQSVDALSKALQEFNGGVVLITHDQRLVSTVAKELWVCRGDQDVELYDGDFEDYKQEIIDEMPDELFYSSDEE